MPKDKKKPDLKGEALGKDPELRESTVAAMPGPSVAREKSLHPQVSINGVAYAWETGHEDGIPEEALTIWARFLEANT